MTNAKAVHTATLPYLQSPSLVVFSMYPGTECEFSDEYFCRLAKQDWGLGTDHLHLLIQLHYPLYPGQGQFLLAQVSLNISKVKLNGSTRT